MATTTTQQLVEAAQRAVKAGIDTGDAFADYVRKHAPKLATKVSHLYVVFRIVRKPEQYGAALAAIKRGSTESLSKLVKPCQRTRGTNSAAATPAPARKARSSVDARLAAALGLDEPAAPRTRKRRADPAPNIAQAVYDDMVRKATENARKVTTRKKD
jgi:hypothetical protein